MKERASARHIIHYSLFTFHYSFPLSKSTKHR